MSNKENNNKRVATKKVVMTIVMAMVSGSLWAQESRFGISPSARVYDAINNPATQLSDGDQGLYASIGIGYTRQSDVRRSSVSEVADDSDRDSAIVITPSVRYKTDIGRHAAEVSVTSQFGRYDDFEDEDFDNYTASALANFDITKKLDLDVYGSFTSASEQRGASGTRIEQDLDPDEVEILGYGGAFTLGRDDSRVQIALGADQDEWRYQNNDQEIRDHDDTGVYGRVTYNVSPRTALFVEARNTDVDFLRDGFNSDSTELSYNVGASWDITAKTSGTVSIGRTDKDFDDPSLADAEETNYAVRLGWSPLERTRFSLYGARQIEESTSVLDNFFISELIGVSVSQSFGSRWNVFGYINNTQDEFDSGREDEIVDYGVGVDYAIRRWLSMGVKYSIIDRDSTDPGSEFKDKLLSLTVNGNFQWNR